MSNETTPLTPPSTALYPTLITPPESGNSIEDPILIFDSDESDVSDTEALDGSVRQLSENSPSPSPRGAARLQPRKLRRHSRDVSPSGGDAKVEKLDEVENTRGLNVNNSDLAHNTPHSSPKLPMDSPNGGTASESSDTRPSHSSTPSASEVPMPMWKLEMKIKEIILKTATETEGQKEGHAYIYADPRNEAGYFKLGKSEDPLQREKELQVKCKHPTFQVVHVVPREVSVPWFSRLESLAHAELANMRYSFECPCRTPHKEYFTGRVQEALEILNFWSSWLQCNPYDEQLQLSPFWKDRLRLLGGKALSHPRCPNIECRSAADIGSSSCQACLRLRLKAWADVTEFDYFEFECRMRIGWGFLRQVIHLMWPRFGSRSFILIEGCEKMKRIAAFLWAPTTHLRFLLLLIFWLWHSSNAPRESILYYGILCFFAYWRITTELDNTPSDSQLTKVQPISRAPGKKANISASNSPGTKIFPNTASEPEMPDEKGPPSKSRSVSVNEPINMSSITRGYRCATAVHEMSETSKAEHNGAKPFLTPDRATRTVGKTSPKAGAKRRKSDIL
ncbi:hypothetical protein Asppvi_001944 [Aspergillus pseudoviridinutans]|uniref:Bacteriophage T5 Orf172 DNA-binding domain-containing protein n=1 Tax=Aspergillus pseudoviridinutans TaxID=1517512 RepID=A0A9P3EY51_9EURO|nr:uncharacterized protein Asppvi_001944 [Aspergillus pseudoviridinutans]GIJ92666.1 hypothetical protein Asppvi_001944 [Aspergillus pseudoviridinutans]